VWSEDFSYAYLKKLLCAIKSRRALHHLCDAPAVLKDGVADVAFVRHDIDIDLGAAVRLARIEELLGIQASYMVMPHNPLYSLSTASAVSSLKEIRGAGHEIGVQFDYSPAGHPQADFAGAVVEACAVVSNVLGGPIRSFSVHRPVPEVLRGELILAERVNAYAAPLMRAYLSDSAGVWRAGDPLVAVEGVRERALQILIHPIWWSEHHASAADRLEEYYRDRLTADPALDRMRLDIAMSSITPRVVRTGVLRPNGE
jgi:hypothetical protein